MSELSFEEKYRESMEAASRGAIPLHEMPDVPDDQPLAQEWKRFKEQVRELIRTGDQGRFALVKGNSLTVWDSLRDADQAGRALYSPEHFLIQEIQLYVKPLRWGYYRVCKS